MSKPIIQVTNISKQYTIGRREAYGSLREEIMQAVTAPFRRIGQTEKRKSRSDPTIWALKDVSFEVQAGEVLGIIGRNGAGKSTLLKILSRITAPTSGRIEIRGRVGSLLEVGTGFHPELTGRENILLNGALLGMTKKEIKSKFDEIVAFSEIEKFLDTPVKRYSSGMYVRLAFAVAAHLEPEILIIDEVLAVGDAQFQKKCLGKMGEVAKGGRTVIFVSHQIDMLRALCDRCILLNNGLIVTHEDTENAIERYIQSFAVQKQNRFFEVNEDPTLVLQIIRGRVINENDKLQDRFDVFDKIILEFEYVVHKTMKGLVVNFDLKHNGVTLFLSFDTDTDLQKIEARVPGLYRSRIELPCPLLKPGNYSITINTGIANTCIYQRLEDIMTFDVELYSRPSSLLSYAEKRAGVIAVPLNWETKLVRNN